MVVSDGFLEFLVDFKFRDKRRISLRFRRRRKESIGFKGLVVIGMMVLFIYNRCWRFWGGFCI